MPARRSRMAPGACSRSNCGSTSAICRPSHARRVAAMTAAASSVSAARMTSWLCASTAISCCATVEVALEQQVLERALQARHLLRQALAAVLLRRALGLRHVIEQVDRAQHRGEAEQDQRDRELAATPESRTLIHRQARQRRRARARPRSRGSLRSSFASTISVISRRPVTASSGVGAAEHPQVLLARRNVQALLRLAGTARRSSAGECPCAAPHPSGRASCSRSRRTSR